MARKKQIAKKATPPAALRASVSFPPDVYRNLEKIAKRNKVSLAWVVRDAAEKYIENDGPGLTKTETFTS